MRQEKPRQLNASELECGDRGLIIRRGHFSEYYAQSLLYVYQTLCTRKVTKLNNNTTITFFSTNGNANYTNLWPELCQNSQAKHSARKRDFVNIDDNRTTLILDNFEYPELSCNTPVKNKSLVPRGHFLSSPSVQILVPVQTSMEPNKSKSLKRYKRSDRICINLQEALEVFTVILCLCMYFSKGI